MACSNCTNTSTSNTGCNCGSLGCPTSLQDKCVTISKSLDVCGEKTIPAGTSLDTVLKDTLSELCQLIDDASGATGPQGPAGATGATGAAGADGADGKGISSIVDNGNGTMTITYTDASTQTISFIDTNKYFLLYSDTNALDITTVTILPKRTYTIPANTLAYAGERIIVTAEISSSGTLLSDPQVGFEIDNNAATVPTPPTSSNFFNIGTSTLQSSRVTIEIARVNNTEVRCFIVKEDGTGDVVHYKPVTVPVSDLSVDTDIDFYCFLSSPPVSTEKAILESFKVELYKL